MGFFNSAAPSSVLLFIWMWQHCTCVSPVNAWAPCCEKDVVHHKCVWSSQVGLSRPSQSNTEQPLPNSEISINGQLSGLRSDSMLLWRKEPQLQSYQLSCHHCLHWTAATLLCSYTVSIIYSLCPWLNFNHCANVGHFIKVELEMMLLMLTCTEVQCSTRQCRVARCRTMIQYSVVQYSGVYQSEATGSTGLHHCTLAAHYDVTAAASFPVYLEPGQMATFVVGRSSRNKQ